jgi:PAS domain-containing protein
MFQKILELALNSLKEINDYKYALDESSIVAITNQRVITYVNDNFVRFQKYSREELIGQDHRIVKSGSHPRNLFVNWDNYW